MLARQPAVTPTNRARGRHRGREPRIDLCDRKRSVDTPPSCGPPRLHARPTVDLPAEHTARGRAALTPGQGVRVVRRWRRSLRAGHICYGRSSPWTRRPEEPIDRGGVDIHWLARPGLLASVPQHQRCVGVTTSPLGSERRRGGRQDRNRRSGQRSDRSTHLCQADPLRQMPKHDSARSALGGGGKTCIMGIDRPQELCYKNEQRPSRSTHADRCRL